jgi:hypothetical protein
MGQGKSDHDDKMTTYYTASSFPRHHAQKSVAHSRLSICKVEHGYSDLDCSDTLAIMSNIEWH